MLLSLMNDPNFITKFLIVGIVMIIALIFHNVFQVWVAKKLGDPSPSNLGYGKFDPQTQLEPTGLILMAIFGLGWPKQIPINGRNLRGNKEALVWYAGPLAYLIVAFFATAAGLIFFKLGKAVLYSAFITASGYAILHAVINLLPVYPLDGAKAALVWGNNDIRRVIRQIQSWGLLGFMGAVIILQMLGITSALTVFFNSIIFNILKPLLNLF